MSFALILSCRMFCLCVMIRWEIQRSKCSAECGEGVQQLSYSCIQTFPETNHRKVVDDLHCPTSQKSKLYEKCMGPCASATWTYEEFGPVRNENFLFIHFFFEFNEFLQNDD